jgi:hypothetical protein
MTLRAIKIDGVTRHEPPWSFRLGLNGRSFVGGERVFVCSCHVRAMGHPSGVSLAAAPVLPLCNDVLARAIARLGPRVVPDARWLALPGVHARL